MKTITSLWVILLGAGALYAQPSLERQVIGATGNFSTAGTVSLSSTVGETVVKTAISGSVVLTQGFQQPDAGASVGINDPLSLLVNYTVAPNPTSERIHVTLSTDKPLQVGLVLFDMRGRQVPVPEQQLLVNGTEETDLDLRTLADGVYQLALKDESGAIFKSFKIQKVH